MLAQMPVELLGQLVELGQQVAWVHMQQVGQQHVMREPVGLLEQLVELLQQLSC